MTTHVPRVWHVCVDVCGDFGRHWGEISLCQRPHGACGDPDLGMTQVTTSNATVLQDGVEVGGFPVAGLSGRERLHGGEDEGQTVCYVLVWSTGQSRRVACRWSARKKWTHCVIFFWQEIQGCFNIIIPAYLPHLQPWLLLLCSVTPALQSPGLSLLQCEGAWKRERNTEKISSNQ